METLPVFKYHPDPIATGSVIESDTECCCCEQERGYVYVGIAYAEEEYVDCICPWCIADGSAHEKLDAMFTDDEGIGLEWDEVSQEIIEEVAYRTPGFKGWQQERWWTHCNEAGQFLGRAGKTELLKFGEAAIKAIQEDTGINDSVQWNAFFNVLDKDNSPTAYIFKCPHCGELGGYQDSL